MTTFDLQHAAMAIPNATAAQKHVLLVLALRADKVTAACNPGMPRIAEDTGLSERTVHRTIVELEQAGHISRAVRPGVGTTYTVHPCHSVTPDKVSPLTQCQATPDTVASELPRTTTSTKTSSSPKKRARVNASIELPDWVPVDPWNGWLEMRRVKGAKETARALTIAIGELRKLADAGHPPGEVLDQSTFRRWTGLFPIKDSRNGLSLRSNDLARPGSVGMAGPRRGYAADMLASALARSDEGAASDPPDDRGAEGPVPAWLRRRP
ncbi:helix-turn-helix domain-containing protein [uncultured Sphingomonas sp.]|uniref:helix-turn-helix domain-containing protein n=1 Tax=uncultured Sphingomonas sp. TaxID=158754 RepID=UPI0035CC072D